MIFNRIWLWLAGAAMAIGWFALELRRAFNRGRAVERTRQREVADEARRAAETAAAAYDRSGGAAERLRKGEF